MNEETLFELALNAPEAERAGLLDRRCAGNPDLRRRVDALLAAHAAPAKFLADSNAPTMDVPAGRWVDRDAVSPPDDKAGTLIGPYKLLQKIGEGGMGTVWMAEQQEPVRRMVAVKLVKAGMDSDKVVARFEAERQALALMDHPNIARIYDAGITGNRPYFVMELVKGTPITQYCDEHRLSPNQRLELFVATCAAIQHAHQKGIIHRDIKPSNVLVAPYDGRPVVKVIDFGVAKATGQRLTDKTLYTEFGAIVGTLEYMSPEQAELNNQDIDTRSDIYALGVLLYELLTGSTPLNRKSLKQQAMLEMLRMVREEEPPKPSTRLSTDDALPSISAQRHMEPAKLTKLMRGELDWIVMKSLEKDRNRRYETANGFAADVQRYMSGEDVWAHPPSTAYRMQKFIRRNRPQVVAAGLILGVLLAGIVGTSLGLLEARHQSARAGAELLEKEKARSAEAEQRRLAVENETLAVQNRNRALEAEREARRQAANSGCDVAQQLCERGSVVQGHIEYGKALKFANEGKDDLLEEAIRFNIDAWSEELHTLVYSIQPVKGFHHPCSCFDPSGVLLAVGNSNPGNKGIVVRLYDAKDGTPKPESIEILGPLRVHRLRWQPQTGRLAIYAGDGRLYFWKPGEPTPCQVIEIDPKLEAWNTVQSPHFAFSPDGARLIAGTSQPVAQVFDVESGKPTGIRFEFENLHSEGIWSSSVDWSRDGRYILVGNHNGMVKIAEAATGKILREFASGPRGLVVVRFAPDGLKFSTGTGHGATKLQVWETQTGKPLGEPFPHLENIDDMDFSPDGSSLLAVDDGYEAFVWSMDRKSKPSAPAWTGGCSEAAFHPGGELFLTTSRQVKVWRRLKGLVRPVPRVDREASRIAPFVDRYKEIIPKALANGEDVNATKLALSPDGKTLIKHKFSVAVGDKPSLAEVIDTSTFQVVKSLPGTLYLPAAYWRPDGREFVTASWSFAKVWDAESCTAKADIGTTCEPWTASFRPDGKRFAISTRDYCMRIFDTAKWKQVGPALPHPVRLAQSAYSLDGRLVLTVDGASVTRIWHPETGKRIGPAIPGYAPHIADDNSGFTVLFGNNQPPIGYRLPRKRSGGVERVIRDIETMTGQQVRDAIPPAELEADTPRVGTDVARNMIGQTVVLEMIVRSTGESKTQEWFYLNSCEDFKDPKNVAIAIKYPTAERRKAMRIDGDPKTLLGRRVSVAGTLTLYREAPQIVVESVDQFVGIEK